MKRTDIAAVLASVLLVALIAILSARERRLPAMADVLATSLAGRLAIIERPSHWPAQGTFGAQSFADIAALNGIRIPDSLRARLRDALRDGSPLPDEVAALVREEHARIERLLFSSRSSQVDPPVEYRLDVLHDARSREFHRVGFALLIAASAVLAKDADGAEMCIDGAAIARDYSYSNGVMGVALRNAILRVLEAPCARILASAPDDVRSRCLAALARISAALPSVSDVIMAEGLTQEVSGIGPALPERWLARLPPASLSILHELKVEAEANNAWWMRAIILDAWPEVHSLFSDVARATQGADAATREAIYLQANERARHSLSPLLRMAGAFNFHTLDELDLESRRRLDVLALAARERK